jgi:hypothetical protein
VLFRSGLAYLLGLPAPRENPARARSWLTVGRPVTLDEAQRGMDVVILRQSAADPGPERLDFRGHVALFSEREPETGRLRVLGANQGADGRVSIISYPESWVLGVRRLWEAQ